MLLLFEDCFLNAYLSNFNNGQYHYSLQASMISQTSRYLYGSTNFYTQRQKYLFKPMFMRTLPSLNNIKIIFRGNPSHYHYIRSNRNQFQNKQKLYAYHKQVVDISLMMLQTKNNQLTYITNRNYESVIAVSREQKTEKQSIDYTVSLKQFIQDNEIFIQKTFLDLHPLQAYLKLMRFIGVRPEKSILDLFQQTSFSPLKLQKHTQFHSFLEDIRREFLETQNQLKLKKLDRKKQCSFQQQQQLVRQWQSHYLKNNKQNINIFSNESSSLSSQQQKKNIEFAIENNIGEFVAIEDLIEGYGENQYYALWEKKEIKERTNQKQ